ncbi:hypothetical protein ACC699_39430, partial [Rhizobium ruizarguesonis]
KRVPVVSNRRTGSEAVVLAAALAGLAIVPGFYVATGTRFARRSNGYRMMQHATIPRTQMTSPTTAADKLKSSHQNLSTICLL